MTRQEKLDIINMKMARTSQSDEGTWCYLPVMIGDVLQYLFDSDRTYDEVIEMIIDDKILSLWDNLRNPLDKEWDNIIHYIYLLID